MTAVNRSTLGSKKNIKQARLQLFQVIHNKMADRRLEDKQSKLDDDDVVTLKSEKKVLVCW